MNDSSQSILVIYKNHRGETSRRKIFPLSKMEWRSTEHHPEAQYIMDVYDYDKQALRSYAVKDILAWGEENVIAWEQKQVDPASVLLDVLDRLRKEQVYHLFVRLSLNFIPRRPEVASLRYSVSGFDITVVAEAGDNEEKLTTTDQKSVWIYVGPNATLRDMIDVLVKLIVDHDPIKKMLGGDDAGKV